MKVIHNVFIHMKVANFASVIIITIFRLSLPCPANITTRSVASFCNIIILVHSKRQLNCFSFCVILQYKVFIARNG